MNIREAAIQELRLRRQRLVQALASSNGKLARNKIAASIFPMVRHRSALHSFRLRGRADQRAIAINMRTEVKQGHMR